MNISLGTGFRLLNSEIGNDLIIKTSQQVNL